MANSKTLGMALCGGILLGFMLGRAYHSDPRCLEDEVVISWHVGYTCEPLDDLPVGLQARIEARQ